MIWLCVVYSRIWATSGERYLRTCACTGSNSYRACAKSHPGICCSLTHFFFYFRMILLADSEGPDQTGQMCRLSRVFAVRKCLKTPFSHGGAYICKIGTCSGKAPFFRSGQLQKTPVFL